jgi:outer membrane protein assembly factor BamB
MEVAPAASIEFAARCLITNRLEREAMFRDDLRRTSMLFGGLVILSLNGMLQPATVQAQRPVELANRMLESMGRAKGLCVVLGSEDGALAVELCRDGQYLVHGLCTSGEARDRARQTIDKAELRGVVSAETGSMERLLYSDNIVNLVVVENTTALLREGLQIKDVLRVLRPGGVAWLADEPDSQGTLATKHLSKLVSDSRIEPLVVIKEPAGVWLRLTKTRPDSMDDWTHARGNASGNPVSTDTQVGVPTGVRWVAGPNWPTGDRKASTPSAVASSEHLAVVFQDEVATDEGMIKEDSLIVRDVFNGLRLWRRKAESMDVLASGGRIYTKVGGQVVALDGETGDIVLTFAVEGPGDFLLSDGLLLVASSKGINAFDIESGESKWATSQVPRKIRVGDGRVFVHVDNSRRGTDSQMVCFDLKTGKQQWAASTKPWAKGATTDLIFYRDGVLVSASSKGNHAVSAEDGSHLWDYTYPKIGHGGSFEKVMASGGLVWIHTADSQGTKQYAWEGLDPKSGKVSRRILQPKEFTYKHRCSYDVGTEQLFLCGSMDFADLETGEYRHFGASRTSCRTAGLVPANGLIYTFPHACGCYVMLRGFLALETNPQVVPAPSAAMRLEKGPRFGAKYARSEAPSPDWPTYRRNVGRSGSTTSSGPEQLTSLWEHTVADRIPESVALEWDHKDGGRLTSPVVAEGLAFVASSDHHRLSALDAKNGEPRWSFTTGGRIDCPPTIDGGLCLLGSHDGFVYCLTADTGELVWRYRAAPRDRRIVAYGQIESAQPVMGGVLVYDGLAYFVVGRHSASDGGLLVQAVEPATGKLVWSEPVTDHEGVPDLLTGGSGTIQMASWEVDAKTGKPKSAGVGRLRGGRLGLLNAAWSKRPIAIRRNLSDWKTGDRPTGQMLAFNDTTTCGYRACEKINTGNGAMSGNARLFAKPVSGKEWSVEMPTTARMRGMVLAGDRLYVAGLLYKDEKGAGASSGVRVYNVADGELLAEHAIEDKLVHDCLAIAGGRLYVSTEDGKLICLGTR